MSKYFTPMNQNQSTGFKSFEELMNAPMQSKKVMTRMPREQQERLKFIVSEEQKDKANAPMEAKEKAYDKQWKADQAKKAAQESMRSAQGEFEASLDKMIKPSMEGGVEGAFNTGKLHVQSFFGDKMADHALQKMAAKKALEKGGEEVLKKGVEGALEKGAGGVGTGAAVQMGLQAAGIDAGGMASDLVGGGDAGGALSGALNAGLSSGFNPVAMGVGAVMGIMSSQEERRAQKREAQAKALEAKSVGESNKARIQGQLSKSMSKTLLSGMNRKVNL